MTDDQIEKLIHMKERLLLVLGYSAAVMCELMVEIGKRLNANEEYKNEKYQWVFDAIENLVYLEKPLPPMP